MADFVTALLVGAAIGGVVGGIKGLLDSWQQKKMTEQSKAEMSDTDKLKALQTRELIQQYFGDDIVYKMKMASNKERIDLMSEFAEALSKEYGLDIQVDVTVSDARSCGAYYWKDKKAVFNIALLMADADNPQFEYCVRETIDTIIHELRHAVQHKAIQEEGFWEVSEERRIEWAHNMKPENYIRAEVNQRRYVSQPVERDAYTFAALAMEGI